MRLSIVLLSRHRRVLLDNLLKSLAKNTIRPELLDVIIGMDTDDMESLGESPRIEQQYSFCTTMFRTRQINMHDYINFMARASVGEYVMVLNDDCEINTYGWDQAVRHEINQLEEKWPDKIFYIGTNDNSIDKVGSREYASFPMLSREAINAGLFMNPDFPCHGADVATWRIYNELGRVYHSQAFEINHVLHASVESLQRKDDTALYMIQRTMTSQNNYWTSDLTPHLNLLRGKMICESV